MPTRTVTVASKSGLHARPASLVSQAAQQAGTQVKIGIPGQDPVDAASVLMLMTLGIEHGATVELSAEGDGADEALDTIAGLIETDLDDPAVKAE